MNKKAIAILGAIFLLIVGTLGFLIYSKYSSNKTQPPANPPNTEIPNNNSLPPENPAPIPDNSNNQPGSQPGGAFVKIGDDQVISPVLFYNGNGVTYFDSGGKLYQADFDQLSGGQLQLKNKRALDVDARANLTQILWPSRGDHFIAVYSDADGKNYYSFYNSDARTFTDLPKQVTSLDWLPGGDKIMFIWTDNGKSTLNVGNPDSKNWQQIAEMWETEDRINISPDGAGIAYYQTANASAANKITLTTPDGKVWKDLVKDGYNFGVLWSPDSQKLLFSKKDKLSGNFQLWYYGINSGELKNLGLFTTTDKAVWDKDSSVIFAAVPVNGSLGSGSLTVDSFYKINTATMEKQEFKPEPSQNLDGRNLFLSSNSDKLFFKNAQDGGLYYLDLMK